MFPLTPVVLFSTAVLGLHPDGAPEEPPAGGEVVAVESAEQPTILGSVAVALLRGLGAAEDADAPFAQAASPRVVEGKPLTVTVTGRAEAGEGDAPKALQLRLVNGEAVVAAGDAAGAPAKKVPFIGVVTAPLAPAVRAQTDLGEDIGLSVESVAPDSPAAKAGLEPFDILAKYDDQLLCAPVQLSALVKRTGTGNTAKLTVIRRGKETPLEVVVGEHLAKATFALERVAVAVGQPDPASPAIVLGNNVVGQPMSEAMLDRIREQADRYRVAAQQYGFSAQTAPTLLPPLSPLPGGPVPQPVPAQPNQRWVIVNPSTTSQSQSTSVFANDEGQVIHREINGVHTISILGPDGQQQYAGPWGGPDDLEKVPEALRGRVEKLRSIPEPPAAPTENR